MFNIGGLGKNMNEFSVTIMYFISSRFQVIFDLENLIIENKRINKFLFEKIEKYFIRSISGIIIDRIKQKLSIDQPKLKVFMIWLWEKFLIKN